MHNVYDLIADFYGNSSEWSEWLSRRFADDFIRTEAFRGATEDELYDTWNCVLTLLVYCGNVDIKMGDMRTDDFIDCFGWCSRNIADFALTYETAEQMLTVPPAAFPENAPCHHGRFLCGQVPQPRPG